MASAPSEIMDANDTTEHRNWLAKIERAVQSFRSSSERAIERARGDGSAPKPESMVTAS